MRMAAVVFRRGCYMYDYFPNRQVITTLSPSDTAHINFSVPFLLHPVAGGRQRVADAQYRLPITGHRLPNYVVHDIIVSAPQMQRALSDCGRTWVGP